ncbi:MAG TPA: hypothetical protein VFQ38_10315 [Longimicrobiales bacterium]|nr:hypothetical protein [Longimicrobiales bacterium]
MMLALDARLRGTSRLPSLATAERGAGALEVAALVVVGAAAAALTNLADFHWGIPGSSIVQTILPMALGFALVPRRGAGSVMGLSAVATSALMRLGGVHLAGVGALTSLALCGPFLDLALRRARGGPWLYGAFVLAGAATNACAFLVRAAAKWLGMRGIGGGMGRRALDAWLPQAVWTYALAGVVAGLVSAALWFHLRERGAPTDGTTP